MRHFVSPTARHVRPEGRNGSCCLVRTGHALAHKWTLLVAKCHEWEIPMLIQQTNISRSRRSNRRRAGMTLVEVIVSLAISGMAVGAIVAGYTYSVTSADKSALTLAASARAMECLELTAAPSGLLLPGRRWINWSALISRIKS